MRQRRKARGGSQIAELAPALLILFIVILFPMLDVMYLGIGYCCGWYLNHLTSRGCSTEAPSSPTGGTYPASVITNLNNAWLGSSLATFTGATIVSNTATAVASGVADPTNPGHNTLYVEATTKVKVNPFMTLPSVPLINSLQIDGLTRPVTFTYFDRVPAQETGVQ